MWRLQLFPKLKSEGRQIRKKKNKISLVYSERLILNNHGKKVISQEEKQGALFPLLAEHLDATRNH